MRLRSAPSWTAAISLIVLTLSTHSGPADPTSPTREPTRADRAVAVETDRSDTTDPPALSTFPVPRDIEFRRTVVGVDGATMASASGEEKLVYSNTLGTYAALMPNGAFIADDLTLVAAPGCSLRRYTFQVIGKADPLSLIGGAYRVDFALYDECPGARPGAPAIAGTGGFVQFPADQESILQQVEFVVPDDVTVSIPSTVWLALKANRNNVGVILGAPALVGFSGDRLDFPGFACSATAGGFPAYSHMSFNATVSVDAACADAYPAYRNLQPGRGGFTEGTSKCIADDIQLNVENCDMVAYEVHVKGAGLYKFDLREDANGLPGAVIPGTAGTKSVPGSATGAQRLPFVFDPPIPLPAKVWLTFQGNNPGAGWILTRKNAEIGTTAQTYAHPPNGAACDSVTDWEALNPADNTAHGGFDVTITCAGQPPAGACCDMFLLDDDGEAVCREVPEMNCPAANVYSRVEWVGGAGCDSSPFTHTCGLSACCTPDDTCENLTANQCKALYPPGEVVSWQRLRFCEERDQKCPYYHCVQRHSGPCGVGHAGPGCLSLSCCQEVSDIDAWCAQVEWDRVCLRETRAAQHCDYTSFVPNESCGPVYEEPDPAAMVVASNSSVVLAMQESYDNDDPGFGCHSGFPAHCIGGDFDGVSCDSDADCRFGRCEPQTPMPGQQGFGSVWFRFVATDESARVSTCRSDSSVDDTLIGVYRPADPSAARACETLQTVACNDDVPACGSGRNATLCVKDLVPGETYYVQVANKVYNATGVLQFDLTSPCPRLIPSDPGPPVIDRADSVASVQLSDLPIQIVDEVSSRAAVETPVEHGLQHREFPNDPPRPRVAIAPAGARAHRVPWVRGPYVSVQVNVDAEGNNIVGDAANEPSIAIDPTDPSKIVIGWRQFDSVQSNFRQAGYGYSHDGGVTWTFPGSLAPGKFGSDPVLASGSNGEFYYLSIDLDSDTRLFRSLDSGVSWDPPRILGVGLDKPWMVTDTRESVGQSRLYVFAEGRLTRTFDEGRSIDMSYLGALGIFRGTLVIGLNGELYLGDDAVYRSSNANDPHARPTFENLTPLAEDRPGDCQVRGNPNPGGLHCQTWIAVDHSTGPTRGFIYTSSVDSSGLEIRRSRDRGETWDPPVRVNDVPPSSSVIQWFPTMSVAPNGRIDMVWNDTRNSGRWNLSETFYSFSTDGGATWSTNVPVSPMWDSYLGWPSQQKIGDYYHMISDDAGANLAYAATFNGEQDVYFLRIGPRDCNHNGAPDEQDIVNGISTDCDENGVPDECARDCNRNGIPDPCESLNGNASDCNKNLIPDVCERDYDLDGVIDDCDPDVDGDGVANGVDRCPFTRLGTSVDASGGPPGDTNKNCKLDLVDYWRFKNCMMNGRLGAPAPQAACLAAFDVNGDGRFDLLDAAAFQRSYGGEP